MSENESESLIKDIAIEEAIEVLITPPTNGAFSVDLDSIDLEALVEDRDAFNRFVYTPLSEALPELHRRWNDKNIPEDTEIPEPFLNGPRGLFFRQLVTPNYETMRFISATDATDLKPLIFEYLSDKFTSNNDWKYFLGKLSFYIKRNIHKALIIENKTIVDFAKYDGKPIRDVLTVWGQSLISFHHQLFLYRFPKLKDVIFDGSEWLIKQGNVFNYYKKFLRFTIKHSILFENFLLDTKEKSFSRDIFLPAFIEVYKQTKLKPLIVALEPTEIEGEDFWFYHPHEQLKFLQYKKASFWKKIGMRIIGLKY